MQSCGKSFLVTPTQMILQKRKQFWRAASTRLCEQACRSESQLRLSFRERAPTFSTQQGREYIDYLCAYGPVLLGHADRRIARAVDSAIRKGAVFGATHPEEVRLAERICTAFSLNGAGSLRVNGYRSVHERGTGRSISHPERKNRSVRRLLSRSQRRDDLRRRRLVALVSDARVRCDGGRRRRCHHRAVQRHTRARPRSARAWQRRSAQSSSSRSPQTWAFACPNLVISKRCAIELKQSAPS